jgi:TPP-dependent pyruvate/acetoin dehydrogenase alpha subunit
MTVKGEVGENPLVPNAKLRVLYETMLKARRLEEAVAKSAKGPRRKSASIRGEEAVRASSVLQLGADDLVSDGAPTPGMGLILGGEPAALLKEFSTSKAEAAKISRLLPAIDETEQRVEMALGSALALKAQQRQGVVTVFLPYGSLSDAAYRKVLKPAAKFELPVIFVVLPRATASKGDGEAVISRVAGKSGVPGIPVDAADSVALYRVVQESLGRARSGDGPVLIECIRWKTSGAKASSTASDPINHLQSFLAGRKIATSAWFKKAESAASRQLFKKQRASNSK